MKKITLLAAACALFFAPAAVAQEAQEVQYVEDATQGYLMNSFKDNWFITAQGGVNVYFSHHDVSATSRIVSPPTPPSMSASGSLPSGVPALALTTSL